MTYYDLCFYQTNPCPSCQNEGHGPAYLPDALLKPIETECRNCNRKWGFAMSEERKWKIDHLLDLAKERLGLRRRLAQIEFELKEAIE